VLHLLELLEDETRPGRLDRAALDIATIQFPDLAPEPFLDQLNDLASRLGDRLHNFNDGRDFVETTERYLFGELGFRGNEDNFFDPLNSCLNQVLERRTGLPITLSVLYMEVARRLHMPVFGIGLPNRFVIQYDDGNYSTFIDPFQGGRTITPRECFALAGSKVADPALLQRVTKKQIVMRMLQNLRNVYVRSRDYTRAVATLDLLIAGAPDLPEWYRARGSLLMEMHRGEAARRDFERYLTLDPKASDRDDIAAQMRWLARLN